MAGTGFALTAYGIGVERGWLNRGQAIDMTRTALRFLKEKVPTEHGFFYHFLSMDQGQPTNGSEVSTIDTVLAAAGILFASQYFNDPEIKTLASEILDRIDWPWMLDGRKTFSLAWNPGGRSGGRFSKLRWERYDESTLLYMMAFGAEKNPIDAAVWKSIHRPVGSYGGHRAIMSPPLFTHQYPHCWLDFRNKNDGYADYFQNSVEASLAQQAFAEDHQKEFKAYNRAAWGFTAAEGPDGYKAYGGPPGWPTHDGTVVTTGCVSSMPFVPQESIECAQYMHQHLKGKIWGRYGFSDCYNVTRNYYSSKAFAINQGPMVIMVENYRTGLVWNVMNQLPYVKRAFERAGFREGTIKLPWPEAPVIEAIHLEQAMNIDGSDADWPKKAKAIKISVQQSSSGSVFDEKDLSAEFKFAWDQKNLYFYAIVQDDSMVLKQKKNEMIWKDDMIELFIDPDLNGLIWGSKKDFQLGFRLALDSDNVITWSWFKSKGDPSKNGSAVAKGKELSETSYAIEGAIKWKFIGKQGLRGNMIGISPSVHDSDSDRTEGKEDFFFRNEEKAGRFELARLRLT